MILPHRIAQAVAQGEVRLAFRRWARPRVAAGQTFRTSAGMVAIDAIDPVDPGTLTDRDAHDAGYGSAAELAATFRGASTDPVFRIVLRWAGPDPRDAVSADADLTADDVAELDAALDRLDRTGSWTGPVLRRIATAPGVAAARLADELGYQKHDLKLRIRKLKALGLTHSLPVGYQLSPRGAAYLDRTRRPDG